MTADCQHQPKLPTSSSWGLAVPYEGEFCTKMAKMNRCMMSSLHSGIACGKPPAQTVHQVQDAANAGAERRTGWHNRGTHAAD